MSAYAIFDVQSHDLERYQTFIQQAKPALRDECSSGRLVSVEGLE